MNPLTETEAIWIEKAADEQIATVFRVFYSESMSRSLVQPDLDQRLERLKRGLATVENLRLFLIKSLG